MRFLRPDLAWWFMAGLIASLLLRGLLRRRLGAAVTTPWIFGRTYRVSPFRRLPAALLFLAA